MIKYHFPFQLFLSSFNKNVVLHFLSISNFYDLIPFRYLSFGSIHLIKYSSNVIRTKFYRDDLIILYKILLKYLI